MAGLEFQGGFTRVPNGLLEALMHYPSSGLKKDILLFLIRYSYGFQRNTADLSLNEISSDLKRTKAKVSQAMKELIDCKVIKVVKAFDSAHQSRTLAINVDSAQWEAGACPSGRRLSKRETVSQTGNRSVSRPGNCTVVHMGNPEGLQTRVNKGSKRTPKKSLKKGKKIYSPNSVEFRLSSLLLRLIKKRRKKFRVPDIQPWCVHIEKLIRQNNAPEEIEQAIIWARNDKFWHKVILNTDRLRKNYYILTYVMSSEQEQNKPDSTNKQNVSESDRIRL